MKHMGKPKEPEPAKLFMSLIAMEDDIFHQGVKDLRSAFGEADRISERLPFDLTDYYTPEMGKALFRHFITFERLIPIPILPDIKQATNRLEEKIAAPDGKRRINIDPGYMCLEHVILATTKGYTHRPYLRDGIYADLTLIYRHKSFQPLEWTYPDYRQEGVIALFNQFRKEYLEDLRGGKQRSC
ncbi:MAG: putative GTP-binding protein [Deltaproteobacteria bacterium]|nr:putative GTP-binding protein [Deltaproteobacteria bacterium]